MRLGRRRAGLLYCYTLMGVALAIGVLYHYRPGRSWPSSRRRSPFLPIRLALSDRNGRGLCPMLAATARLQLAVGLLLTIGLLV